MNPRRNQLEWGPVSSVEKDRAEDILRAMLECEYRGDEASDAVLSALAGCSREGALNALQLAREHHLIRPAGAGWKLEHEGRVIAVRIMRAHRLTETRLARESGLPAAEWHGQAHRIEHTLSTQQVDQLADKLGNPRFDPHGDAIPTREGDLPIPEEEGLLAWPVGRPAIIAHIEDEPPVLFQQLVRLGLFAGMRLKRSEGGGVAECLVTVEGRAFTLSHHIAALVRVRPLGEDESDVPAGACRLDDLEAGSQAEVLTLLPGCLGTERSRLLDLGFVPGTPIEHSLTNPLHGSAAYSVRGTLIALRQEQAAQILILPAHT